FDERDVETEPRLGYLGTARRKGRQQITRTYRHRATSRLYRPIGPLPGQNRTVALDSRISPKPTLAGGERNRWLSMARCLARTESTLKGNPGTTEVVVHRIMFGKPGEVDNDPLQRTKRQVPRAEGDDRLRPILLRDSICWRDRKFSGLDRRSRQRHTRGHC